MLKSLLAEWDKGSFQWGNQLPTKSTVIHHWRKMMSSEREISRYFWTATQASLDLLGNQLRDHIVTEQETFISPVFEMCLYVFWSAFHFLIVKLSRRDEIESKAGMGKKMKYSGQWYDYPGPSIGSKFAQFLSKWGSHSHQVWYHRDLWSKLWISRHAKCERWNTQFWNTLACHLEPLARVCSLLLFRSVPV